MRDYFLSGVRHLAGAAAAAVLGFAASKGLDPEAVGQFADAAHALVLGAGFAVYALVEKALKPVFSRLFGSSGS